jgi:hypothetical protein
MPPASCRRAQGPAVKRARWRGGMRLAQRASTNSRAGSCDQAPSRLPAPLQRRYRGASRSGCGLFHRRRALLHRPGGFAGGLAGLPIEVLNRTRGLPDRTFNLTSRVARGPSKALLHPACGLIGGARDTILIHGTIPFAVPQWPMPAKRGTGAVVPIVSRRQAAAGPLDHRSTDGAGLAVQQRLRAPAFAGRICVPN